MSFPLLLQYFQQTLIEGKDFSYCRNKTREFGWSYTRHVCAQIAFHWLYQRRVERGFGGSTPPLKFRSFDKAEPNSQFRGIYRVAEKSPSPDQYATIIWFGLLKYTWLLVQWIRMCTLMLDTQTDAPPCPLWHTSEQGGVSVRNASSTAVRKSWLLL
jgi:hypothetical protein